MEVLFGKTDVSLVDLTYEEAEMILAALDCFRYNRSLGRADAEYVDEMYIVLDEALHPVDDCTW